MSTAAPAVALGDRVPPQLLLVAAAVSLQTGSAVATTLFDDLGATGVLALRMGVGAVFLVAIGRPWRVRVARRAWPLVAAFGAVLGTMNLLFYLSLERIPLGVTVALELVGPLAVALVGSRSRRDLLWAAVAAAGVAVLVAPSALAALSPASPSGPSGPSGPGGALDPLGVALALAAGACWAGYIVLGSRMSGAVPGTAGLAWAMVLASAVLLPLGAAGAGTALLQPAHLLAGVAVGLMSSALPYALEIATLRRIGPRAFGVMMSLEPAVALATGLVVVGQRPGALALVGVALVVCASLGAFPRRARA